MHMMRMLGIVSLVFLIALFLLCLFRKKLKAPLFNPLFLIADAVFLFAWTYAMFEHNGLKNGFMTLDNISPYVCTVIPFTPLLDKRVKEFVYSGIAFLSFGMFIAMFISPEVEYLFNFHQDSQFLHVTEAACHLIMSLYGFFLILSDRVKVRPKNLGKGMLFVYASIAFGVFLNYFFHRSFFGMDMHGDASIYFMDFFDSFEMTFLAYILGVFVTMAFGYLIGAFVDWLTREGKQTAPSDPEA